ncbi:MAG: NAD(P)-dependent oxidoreductase [Pirellulales bacterium]
MNVFLAGATGVMGRRLIAQLVARGHVVTALVRSRDGERSVTALGAQARYADLFDANNLVHAAKGADVVIHAATAIPTKPRTALEDWKLNDRIRREGTAALARCAGQVGARTFLFQSIVWVANPPDGSPFDEQSPTYPDNITQSALDGEGIAQEMAELHGFDAAVLRCGTFYGADAAHTRGMAQALARRKMPIIGSGKNFWHSLHIDDAASAFVVAAEAGRAGLWHVVDNEPVMQRELLTTFAQTLGGKPPRRMPVWLARWLAGSNAVDFLIRSTRTSNARFRNDLDWNPQYPTFRQGLEQVLSEWGGKAP